MQAPLSDDYSWLFDLAAVDDQRRAAALDRHRALLAEASQALAWMNRVRRQAGSWAPEQPHLAAEMDQARTAIRWSESQTIFGPIGAFLESTRVDPVAHLLYAPFGVLFLQWEARYPAQWREAGRTWRSPWSTKESLLARFAAGGVPEQVQPQMTDLVVAAVQRPYRCKDWRYADLTRHLASPRFARKIEQLSHADQPLIALRAQFLKHLSQHPNLRVKRTTWHQWLSTHLHTDTPQPT